jgi:hypothetical protein
MGGLVSRTTVSTEAHLEYAAHARTTRASILDALHKRDVPGLIKVVAATEGGGAGLEGLQEAVCKLITDGDLEFGARVLEAVAENSRRLTLREALAKIMAETIALPRHNPLRREILRFLPLRFPQEKDWGACLPKNFREMVPDCVADVLLEETLRLPDGVCGFWTIAAVADDLASSGNVDALGRLLQRYKHLHGAPASYVPLLSRAVDQKRWRTARSLTSVPFFAGKGLDKALLPRVEALGQAALEGDPDAGGVVENWVHTRLHEGKLLFTLAGCISGTQCTPASTFVAAKMFDMVMVEGGGVRALTANGHELLASAMKHGYHVIANTLYQESDDPENTRAPCLMFSGLANNYEEFRVLATLTRR